MTREEQIELMKECMEDGETVMKWTGDNDVVYDYALKVPPEVAAKEVVVII